jgi:hypothetical protein
MSLQITRCKHCGQSDDHPKVIVSDGEVFHHDCVDSDLREALVNSNPNVAQIIAAAEGGTHGDDLRTLIQSLPEGE